MMRLYLIFSFTFLWATATALGCPAMEGIPPSTGVKVDTESHYRREALNKLAEWGFQVDPATPINVLFGMYLNAQNRLISDQKRTVHLSKALQAKLDNHQLPPEIEKGVHEIIFKAETGKPLQPHQSKKITSAEYSDSLLDDWAINHLHLGTTFEPNGKFITRTNELLFVHVTDKDIYLVDVMPHGNSFSDAQVLNTLHRSWPTLLHSFEGYSLADGNLTAEQRKFMRKAHFVTGVEMDDGTLYISPGGGFTAAGNNANHQLKVQDWMWQLRKANMWLLQQEGLIRAMYLLEMKRPPPTLDLELQFLSPDQTYMVVKEKTTQSVFRLDYLK